MLANNRKYVVTTNSSIKTVLCQVRQFTEEFRVDNHFQSFTGIFYCCIKQVKLQSQYKAFNYRYFRLADQTYLTEIFIFFNVLYELVKEVLTSDFWTFKNTNAVNVRHWEVSTQIIAAEHKEFKRILSSLSPFLACLFKIIYRVKSLLIFQEIFTHFVLISQQVFKILRLFLWILKNVIFYYFNLARSLFVKRLFLFGCRLSRQ